VSLHDAAESLRWARLTLVLAERGVIAREGPTRTVDHLGTVIALQDEGLARALIDKRLAALRALPAAERDRLIETLAGWIDHQRHTPRVAEDLHVHQQTVRYRIARLRELVGDALDTPSGRFELALALRAWRALYDRPKATIESTAPTRK
jgi:DNA-binding PucR family transcriptional regulator